MTASRADEEAAIARSIAVREDDITAIVRRVSACVQAADENDDKAHDEALALLEKEVAVAQFNARKLRRKHDSLLGELPYCASMYQSKLDDIEALKQSISTLRSSVLPRSRKIREHKEQYVKLAKKIAVNDRAQLEPEIERLASDREAFDAERVALIDQINEKCDQFATLLESVTRLRDAILDSDDEAGEVAMDEDEEEDHDDEEEEEEEDEDEEEDDADDGEEEEEEDGEEGKSKKKVTVVGTPTKKRKAKGRGKNSRRQRRRSGATRDNQQEG